MPFPDFTRAIQQKPLDLPLAALLAARGIAYPALDVFAYLDRLDVLTQQAASAIAHTTCVEERATQLAHFLFEQEGFLGNEAEYHDPRNSYLNELLDRKLGIPISLSVLFLIVAQKTGIPAEGIGLPGHFVVGIRQSSAKTPILLDPFHAGTELSLDDCLRLISNTTGYRGALMPQWLDPSSPRLILIRMLNNVRLTYLTREDWPCAVKVVQHLQIIQPNLPEHIRDEGLIAYQQGNLTRAVQLLEAYLTRNPAASDADSIRKGIFSGLNDWVRKN